MVSRQAMERLAQMALEILGPDQDTKAILDLTHYTLRKWERTGQDEDYLFILYEDELLDFARRKIINEIGRENYERNNQDGAGLRGA